MEERDCLEVRQFLSVVGVDLEERLLWVARVGGSVVCFR